MLDREFHNVPDLDPGSFADLRNLADRCEQATPDEYAEIIAQAAFLGADYFERASGLRWQARLDEALHLAKLGASESAVLTFIPDEVNLTAGAFAGRTDLIAQALVPGHGNSHSRRAKSLGMAWLAAFLRALASPAERKVSGVIVRGQSHAH